MPAKHTPRIISGASAAEKIHECSKLTEALKEQLHSLYCFGIINQNLIDDVLFKSCEINDRPGFYYCGDDQRKVLGFASAEIWDAAFELEKLTDALQLKLIDLRDCCPEGGAA